jgi:uncharacterized protein YciI
MKRITVRLIVTLTLALILPPLAGDAQQPPKVSLYAIFLKLAPEVTAQVSYPGVMDAVGQAARAGQVPAVQDLVALGQTEAFARVFVERLRYLMRLREAGILRASGPFADLKEGMYLCNAVDEREARRIVEEDPFYQAGLIEREFTVRQWLAAL